MNGKGLFIDYEIPSATFDIAHISLKLGKYFFLKNIPPPEI